MLNSDHLIPTQDWSDFFFFVGLMCFIRKWLILEWKNVKYDFETINKYLRIKIHGLMKTYVNLNFPNVFII